MTEAEEAAARASIPAHVLARAVEQAATDRATLARLVAEGRVRAKAERQSSPEARAFIADIETRAFGPGRGRINLGIRPKAKRRRR